MVSSTARPSVPVVHTNEAEHRRLLADRANASMPKDGTEGMAAPLRLQLYDTLPDATLWDGGMAYDDDENVPAFSDGIAWFDLAKADDVGTVSDALAALSALVTPVEGSWTPTLAFGGSSTGITYSTQVGRYIKQGNLVSVWARVELTNNGSGTGACTVGGLPYAASTVSGLIYPGLMTNYANISTAVATALFCSIASGASVINLFGYLLDTVSAALNDTDVDNDAAFSLQATYRTG